MKTIEEIKSEIAHLDSLRREEYKSGAWKRIGNKRDLLVKCVYYLETNPSEEFINKSFDDLKNKITLIKEGYWNWLANTPGVQELKNPHSKYDTEFRMKELLFQVATFNYLLNLEPQNVTQD